MYDIVFISYQEPNADKNYSKLKERFPTTKRVHGIKGIHQAHIAAAKKSFTKMFWVVDADAEVLETFDFSYKVDNWNKDTVHVWQSQNPINDLVYGYGGIKLLPRKMTINMDLNKPDITTSISKKFKLMTEISNITKFDTDPFNTWKSSFRECCKLSSKSIDRQQDKETSERLQIWQTAGDSKQFGKYAIKGAKQGTIFGTENANNPEALKLINDFEWLKSQFKED